MKIKKILHKLSYYVFILSTLVFLAWATGADTPMNFRAWQDGLINILTILVVSVLINQLTKMKKYYTVETIRDAYNNLAKWQKAYIREITSLIEEEEADDFKVINNLTYYVKNISDVEITEDSYEDILNIVY